MTTTRATAAVLEAIQALNNGSVKFETGVLTHGEHDMAATIVFKATWQGLGICYQCGSELENRRFKECEKCRNGQ